MVRCLPQKEFIINNGAPAPEQVISHFTGLDFKESDLSRSIIDEAYFYDCCMDDVKFFGCDLRNAKFGKVKLKKAHFGGFFGPKALVDGSYFQIVILQIVSCSMLISQEVY